MPTSEKNGKLASVLSSISKREDQGLTAPEIAMAFKATLLDFVGGSTDRKSVSEVGRLLSGALAARRASIEDAEESGVVGEIRRRSVAVGFYLQ